MIRLFLPSEKQMRRIREAHGERELAILMEYRLRSIDVAELVGATKGNVTQWSDPNYGVTYLPYRIWPLKRHQREHRKLFRLYDVEMLIERLNKRRPNNPRTVHYELLPEGVRKAWKVGEFAPVRDAELALGENPMQATLIRNTGEET